MSNPIDEIKNPLSNAAPTVQKSAFDLIMSQPLQEAPKPTQNYEVGQDWYSVGVDHETGDTWMDHYKVSAIRKNRVHLIRITDYTWKNGQFTGNAQSYHKESWPISYGLPESYARSPEGAYSKSITAIKAAIEKLEKQLSKLTGLRTKARNKKKAKKKVKAKKPGDYVVVLGRSRQED